jgi:SAM-dependent methyltransferase
MSVIESLKRLVPPTLRPAARNLYHSATDTLEVWTGRRDPLTPPRRMWELVTSPDLDFKAEGEGLLRFMIDECGLLPGEAVLDVGCGIGRNAVPLIGYLGDAGTYEGFDIMPEAVAWCQKNITPRHPNFRFQLADVRSDRYNPGGRSAASRYAFPFNDGTFDFVFLASVFTHMMPADLERYLSEIARVLRPGGRAMISYFLLNDSSRRHMTAGESAVDFKFDVGGCYAQLEELPEAALAYDEKVIRTLYEKNGLLIREPIGYGAWSTSKAHAQDIVIATKL